MYNIKNVCSVGYMGTNVEPTTKVQTLTYA